MENIEKITSFAYLSFFSDIHGMNNLEYEEGEKNTRQKFYKKTINMQVDFSKCYVHFGFLLKCNVILGGVCRPVESEENVSN